MVDKVYQDAFKEINDIFEYTDKDLVNKIPTKFISFIQSNMNKNHLTKINIENTVDEQNLLRETEMILSLIYRNYWATEDEILEFSRRDYLERIENEKKKQEKYNYDDIEKLFEKRKNKKQENLSNNLIIVKDENVIKKIFRKILKFIKRYK